MRSRASQRGIVELAGGHPKPACLNQGSKPEQAYLCKGFYVTHTEINALGLHRFRHSISCALKSRSRTTSLHIGSRQAVRAIMNKAAERSNCFGACIQHRVHQPVNKAYMFILTLSNDCYKIFTQQRETNGSRRALGIERWPICISYFCVFIVGQVLDCFTYASRIHKQNNRKLSVTVSGSIHALLRFTQTLDTTSHLYFF